jgi:nitrite reductase/ring-hydroxylating ferredoxin subunit
MFVEAAKISDIAINGMKAVETGDKEIVLCNYEGKIYAIERHCGHMKAPLEMGTLDGYILTCPMHYAQFDITTGEALSGPVPRAQSDEQKSENTKNFSRYMGSLMTKIDTHDIKTFPVKVEGDTIKVDL